MKMAGLDLVTLIPDQDDTRRKFVALTDLAADRLDAYFRLAPVRGELLT
jgi:hypothetical protein